MSRMKIRKSKYTLNHYYFDIIDNEHKAYWLGFLYADGYHQETRYRIKLSIQEKDDYILEEFRKDINSNKPIKTEKPKNINWQNMKTVQLASKYLSARLKELGIHQNKSFTVKFPTNKQVPDHLIRHFIRGYFDGDGCIYHNSRYKTYRLSFVGSVSFTNDLSKLIVKTYKIRTSFETKTNNKNQTIQSINIKAKNSIKLLLNWMYKDATIYLHRKYDKCKELNMMD